MSSVTSRRDLAANQGADYQANFFHSDIVPVFQHCENILPIEYHIHFLQVSPQLCSGDTRQISMWLKRSKRHFYEIRNTSNVEMNEQHFFKLLSQDPKFNSKAMIQPEND